VSEGFAVGIDLGTSTSEVCVFRNGRAEAINIPGSRSPIMPSYVGLNPRNEILVGEPARGIVDTEDRGVREVKRKMGTDERVRLGGKEYRPQEISALILRQLKETAEAHLGAPVSQAVISVPANFDDLAKRATYEAAEIAGLKVLLLVAEPTAAALAWGIDHLDAEEQVLVFDFGGGTLDITILEMVSGIIDVRCSFGDVALGGKNFDEVMIALLKQRVIQQVPNLSLSPNVDRDLKAIAEKTKISLSTESASDIFLRAIGMSVGRQVDLDVTVTREEYEERCQPLLKRTRDCLLSALRTKEIKPSVISKVILVGGTTYIPAVRRVVEETLGRTGSIEVDPDLAVGLGAAIRAGMVTGLVDPLKSVVATDVAPKGVGVSIIEMIGSRPTLVYEPLIKPNATIPYHMKKIYYLISDEQDIVNLDVYQDSTGRARLPEDAKLIMSGKITGIPPSEDGKPHPIEISFQYDISGTIRLEGRIAATGQAVLIEERISATLMTEGEKKASEARMHDLWLTRPQAREYRAVLAKAERVLDQVDAERRRILQECIVSLKQAIEAESETEARRHGDRLVDLLYDFERETEE